MAEISVLIPCRQHGHFLDDALASVFAQTGADLEAVVANDGSTDNTEAVVRRWQRAFPDRVLTVNTGGIGQARARRRAADLARGAYWITLDADDRLEPAMAETCRRVLARHPQAAAAAADVWMTDADGQRAIQVLKQRRWPGWPEVLDACPIGNWSSVLIRADVARRVGGIGLEGEAGAEDWDFAVRLVRAGLSIVGVGAALARYRQCPDSHSRDPVPAFRAKVAMLERCRTDDPRLAAAVSVQPVLDEAAYWHYRNRYLFFAWGLAAAAAPAAADALVDAFGGRAREWDGWASAYAHGVAHAGHGGIPPPRVVPPEVRAAVTEALRRAACPAEAAERFFVQVERAVWKRHFRGPRYWRRRLDAWLATRRFRRGPAPGRPPASPAT